MICNCASALEVADENVDDVDVESRDGGFFCSLGGSDDACGFLMLAVDLTVVEIWMGEENLRVLTIVEMVCWRAGGIRLGSMVEDIVGAGFGSFWKWFRSVEERKFRPSGIFS